MAKNTLTVNCEGEMSVILTLVVFLTKLLVPLTFYTPKQWTDTQSCVNKQVEWHKQTSTKHSFKNNYWWDDDSDKHKTQTNDYHWSSYQYLAKINSNKELELLNTKEMRFLAYKAFQAWLPSTNDQIIQPTDLPWGP